MKSMKSETPKSEPEPHRAHGQTDTWCTADGTRCTSHTIAPADHTIRKTRRHLERLGVIDCEEEI